MATGMGEWAVVGADESIEYPNDVWVSRVLVNWLVSSTGAGQYLPDVVDISLGV